MLKTIFCAIAFSSVVTFLTAADFGDINWEYQTGDSVTSSPTLDSAGNVFFGSLDDYVYSLDGYGELRWRYDSGDWVDSSPVLSRDETALYVGSWGNKLIALDATTGGLLWDYETDSLVYASPAVAEDGTIYFGSSDGLLYALHPDGTLKWEFEVGGELDSSPAIDAAGNVYVGSSSGFVSSISPDGAERWSWDVPISLATLTRDFGITSSPMLTSEGDVIVGSQNFFVYCLRASNGTQRWSYPTDGIVEGSAVEGMGRSCLFAGRDGFLYSLSWDGGLNWKTFVGPNYYSTPCVDGMGRIYAGVLRGSTEGSLVVLSSEGAILWQTDFDGFVDSSPLLGPDGTVYVGNNNGRLYAIEGGDKLASLGWSSFRGGLMQRGSLQGYEDLTALKSDLYVASKTIDGTDQFIANYRVEGGGPMQVEIRAMGTGFQESVVASGYSLSLVGASGEMAFADAFLPIDGNFDGTLKGWLEPGAYRVEAINESDDRGAFFLEVDIQ